MAYDTEDKIQILIADDSALNREILKNILEKRYAVVEASSGQEAMDLMQDGATEFAG